MLWCNQPALPCYRFFVLTVLPAVLLHSTAAKNGLHLSNHASTYTTNPQLPAAVERPMSPMAPPRASGGAPAISSAADAQGTSGNTASSSRACVPLACAHRQLRMSRPGSRPHSRHQESVPEGHQGNKRMCQEHVHYAP